MNPGQYATAVIDMLSSGTEPERVLQGLDRVLTSRGHLKMKKAILQNVLKLLQQRTKTSQLTVRVARQADVETYADAIKEICTQYALTQKPETVIDETLIGGFTLETSDQRIDKSYKRILLKLYRNIINQNATQRS